MNYSRPKASLNMALARVCQPLPDDFNCSRTSGSSMMLTRLLRMSSGMAGRPRLAVAKNSSSNSSASPSSLMYDLRSDIKSDLSLVGLTQADKAAGAVSTCPNSNIVSVTDAADGYEPVFPVVNTRILARQRKIPSKPIDDAEIALMLFKVADALRRIPGNLHAIYIYTLNSTFKLMRGQRGGQPLGASAAIFATLFAASPLTAKDLGVHGPLFEVAEPSILKTIKTRLQEMEADGQLDVMKRDMQDRTKAYVNRPRPVLGVGKAEEYASWDVDLSITLDRDLADHNGVVFARAGTVVNPMGYSQFNKRIVVLDGDDPAQVDFALSEGNELDTLLVLVNGDPLGLTRQHGRRFYFDQDGVITKRFAIANVPAVIRRTDPVMQVEEIPVGGEMQ